MGSEKHPRTTDTLHMPVYAKLFKYPRNKLHNFANTYLPYGSQKES